MKVLLTIGYTDILLPDDSGISTIMKCLSKGALVEEHLYKGIIKLRGPNERNSLELKMQMVPETTQFLLNDIPVEVNQAGQPKRKVREHPLNAGAKGITTGQRQLGY